MTDQSPNTQFHASSFLQGHNAEYVEQLYARYAANPDAVKELYLSYGQDGTVVTAKVDGMPHRMLRTKLEEEVEQSSGVRRLGPTARRTLEFKRMSGMSWRELAKDGRSMKQAFPVVASIRAIAAPPATRAL